MTKEEAEKKLEELESRGLGFCPIIDHGCQRSCVCYVNGMVYPENGGYFVATPWCKHKLLEVHKKVVR
jgi:hypothetical protein